jgi:hypothetical protein
LNQALPRIVWGLVAIVLLIGLMRVVTTHNRHRSADQKILLEKAK